MATRFPPRKQSVDLAAPALRGSRIRRDPPPPAKPVSAAEIRERETWTAALGIVVLALAAFVVLIALGNAAGWSPRDYTVQVG